MTSAAVDDMRADAVHEPHELIRMSAYITGTVVEITPRQGVAVESRCAFLQGIFGVGGETSAVTG